MTTNFPKSEFESIRKKPSLVNGFFRKQVLAQMGEIQDALIRVVDTTGVVEIGDANADSTLAVELKVFDQSFYQQIALGGSVGAAESYMKGEWCASDLTALVRILVRNRDRLDELDGGKINLTALSRQLWHRFNRNTVDGSKKNISAHYDLSNDFFKLFLDSKLMYSSAVFENREESLEVASERKLKQICEQLQLKSGETVIEIGTGWGGFAIYAAKNYGVKVTTTTISDEQYDEAVARVAAEGLSDKITLLKKDYRKLRGQFDKLVSIEMVEAVGHHFVETYFQQCADLLKPSGLALIQAITLEDYRYEQSLKEVDFIKRYIFPGSFIPCVNVLNESAAKAHLRNIKLTDIGSSYALTLNHWRSRFMSNIDAVKELGFDERFIRMWEFYLCYCEGGFIEGAISDVHLVYAKPEYVRQNPSV